MLEELHTASSLLRVALGRYINACSTLRNGCSYKRDFNGAPEILDAVTNELDLVESYKSKLVRAQVSIKSARNNLANVPINALPAEVLTHIFHLVLSQQPCPLRVINHWNLDSLVHIPRYPDTLSHVCSQWRQIALASHSLWSHIDIALSCPLSKRFHKRAITYVARARQAPLDIHFVDPGCIRPADDEISGSEDEDNFHEWSDLMYDNNPKEFTFLLSSPEARIRSLGLLVYHRYHHIHSRALEHCLINCLPSGLSEFLIDVPCERSPSLNFFEVSPDLQNPEDASSTRLFLSEQQLESAWHPTTSLVLKGRYPRWASTAYQGLTELQLLGKQAISISDLAGVLESSPGLRIIHCDFRIGDLLHPGTLSVPVTLQELEVLDLRAMYSADIEQFLQLLNPGPRPLRLLVRGDPTSTPFEDFFARSNVQEMWTEPRFQVLADSQLPPHMFYLPPQLQTLVVSRWGWGSLLRGRGTHTPLGLCNDSPSSIKLGTLYLLSCRYVSFAQFQEIVAKLSPRRLIVWRCVIFDHVNSTQAAPYIDLPILQSVFGDGLSQICPSIECLTVQDPNPLQTWD